jgi:hypothetical protein
MDLFMEILPLFCRGYKVYLLCLRVIYRMYTNRTQNQLHFTRINISNLSMYKCKKLLQNCVCKNITFALMFFGNISWCDEVYFRILMINAI